jgi:hypothetical protein
MDSTDGKAATTTSLNAGNKNTVPPPQLFPMSQANGGNNEVKGEVGGGVGMACPGWRWQRQALRHMSTVATMR